MPQKTKQDQPVYIFGPNMCNVWPSLHIEDFTRARVNESDLTTVLVETGAMPVTTKLRNPTVCG